MVSSPDGSRVASVRSVVQGGSFVDLFDGRSGRLISELTGRLDDIEPESAAFSPDSKELFVQGVSSDSGIQVFRIDVRGKGHLRDVVQIGWSIWSNQPSATLVE